MEGKKQHPFFLLEKQQHGLEWHVANQVFRFVYKESYGKKALLVVHAGLERGSREGDSKIKPSCSCE